MKSYDNYILDENSPIELCKDYQIALNSIKLDYRSADYIDMDDMTAREKNKLIKAALKNGYKLHNNSSIYFLNNQNAIIQALNDMNSEQNDINISILINSIRNQSINILKDKEIMMKILNLYISFKNINSDKYKNNYINLYSNIISHRPTIEMFKIYIDYATEIDWQQYKNDNLDAYNNIFGKILSHLRYCENMNEIYTFHLLTEMKKVLNQKYDILLHAMEQYYMILNSDIDNKIPSLKVYIDKISNLSALYIAKSKENYKSSDRNKINDWLKKFFKLKKNIPLIENRVLNYRRLENLKKLYENQDKNLLEFLDTLYIKYQEYMDINTFNKLVKGIIIYKSPTLRGILGFPERLCEYENYKKILKIINRLNQKYITYDSPETFNCSSLITFDGHKYSYNGPEFSDQEIDNLENHLYHEYIYKQLKKDIMLKAKDLPINDRISPKMMKELSDSVPFTDEYFEFNDNICKKLKIKTLFDHCMVPFNEANSFDDILMEQYFELLNNTIDTNGLVWFILLQLSENKIDPIFVDSKLDQLYLRKIIDNMFPIFNTSKKLNWPLNKFNDLFLLNDELEYCSDIDAALLGPELLKGLYSNIYEEINMPKTIKKASQLVAMMSQRYKSTVPYISGTTQNYKYSLYDSFDEDLLLSGVKTNSCFAINDTDSDFLHYVALDKNGFAIKITDIKDNFIARAAGFRNGNCVFINQLRTIYDKGGHYNGNTYSELNDIVETFKKACQDIVDISKHNKEDKDKIDYVFVTQSYCLNCYPCNVNSSISDMLGIRPMDTKSEDWQYFIDNTPNLDYQTEDFNYFETDYGNYDLICIATAKSYSIKTSDIHLKDVKAVYKRKRNPIMIGDKNNQLLVNKLYKIYAIDAKLKCKDFNFFTIPDDSLLILGDNWAIIYYNNQIFSHCLIDNDPETIKEFKIVLKSLKKHNNKVLKKKF